MINRALVRIPLAAALIAVTMSCPSARAQVPGKRVDFLGYFRQSKQYHKVASRGSMTVVDLPEEDSFFVLWLPPGGAVDNLMVLLHGTGGTAYDEIADEMAMAEKYGYAVAGIQWLDKDTGHYFTAGKIYRMIDKAFRFIGDKYGLMPSRAALCGFSRGSAISYEVAYLDKSGERYFDLTISHSGGIPFDNVVAPGEGDRPGLFFSRLSSGEMGSDCFEGMKFFLYAGEKDEEWGDTMAKYMRHTADLIESSGGEVERLIIDPELGHSGYRDNTDYHESAVRSFLGLQ